MDQMAPKPSFAKPFGGFVVVMCTALFIGGWLYVDMVKNELEMKVESLQAQLDAAKAPALPTPSEPKKIAAEGIYQEKHEVLPAADGAVPKVVSRIYRVMTGGERTLVYTETNPGEELHIFILEGRRLMLFREDMDRSPGPCECGQILEKRAYLALDLDDPGAGLKEVEPTPAISLELQSRYEACQRSVQADPVCNE